MKIKDKVIWITGASSGIGEALAKAAVKEGAKVVISARREDKLVKLKESIESEDILVLPMDIADFDSLQAKYENVIYKFGRVDILVNNAGISQRSLFAETDFSVMQKVMNVNYMGTAALTRIVVPGMIEQKSGYILALSSIAGKFSTPLRTIYSSAKMALQGLFDGLRAELYKHNVKVALVVPGFVKTEISLNAVEASGEKHGKMDPNQASGISAEAAAKTIINGIKKEKREIFMGLVPKTRIALFLAKYYPGVFAKIMRNAEVT